MNVEASGPSDNPFAEAPILFQEAHIRGIYDRIAGSPEQGPLHFSIFGPPRMGKTTLLRHVAKSDRANQFEGGANIHLAYLACNTLDNRQNVFKILADLLIAMIPGVPQQGPIQQALTLLNKGDNPAALMSLVQYCNGNNIQPVFLLDDFDYLVDLLAAYDLSFLRELITTTRTGLVISHRKKLPELLRKIGIPSTFSTFYPDGLEVFSKSNADLYLEKLGGAIFSQKIKNWIVRQAGVHPCFLQIAASLVWEDLPLHPDILDHEADLLRQLDRALEKDFQEIWQVAEEHHRSIIYQIAVNGTASDIDMQDLLNIERDCGALWRDGPAFVLMGERFKMFVIAQTESVNRAIMRGIYESGVRFLSGIPKDIREKAGTPRLYYQKAFEALEKGENYEATLHELRATLDTLLEARVVEAEIRSNELLPHDATLNQRVGFLIDKFTISRELEPVLRAICENLFEHRNKAQRISHSEIVFQFYALTSLAQYLLSANPRSFWRNTEYEQVQEIATTDRNQIIRARHVLTGLDVVIKCPHDRGPNVQASLIRQGQILGSLANRNIVKLIGLTNDPPGLVMEWIAGDSIATKLGNGVAFTPWQTLEIVKQVAEALREIHLKRIIHNDLKPSNILLLDDTMQPVLIDFDIACRLDDPEWRNTSGFEGTRPFASPEQLRGDRSHRETASDIFSLGLIMYQMLTGQLPYENGNNPEQYVGGHLPAPARIVGRDNIEFDIPNNIYNILCLMLQEDPAERPADGDELIRLLKKTTIPEN